MTSEPGGYLHSLQSSSVRIHYVRVCQNHLRLAAHLSVTTYANAFRFPQRSLMLKLIRLLRLTAHDVTAGHDCLHSLREKFIERNLSLSRLNFYNFYGTAVGFCYGSTINLAFQGFAALIKDTFSQLRPSKASDALFGIDGNGNCCY